MILTKVVEATVSGRSKRYYEDRGYPLPYVLDSKKRKGIKKGTKIKVRIEDLPPTSNIKIEYECDDCKKVYISSNASLIGRKNSQFKKTGETICARCAPKRMMGANNKKYIHGNNRYCEYRNNARKRKNIVFELSVEDFEQLINKECHYCGGFSSEWNTKSRGNGIDRKNNDLGYSIDNCIPCCSKCNFIKNSMPYELFIAYIKRIAKRF